MTDLQRANLIAEAKSAFKAGQLARARGLCERILRRQKNNLDALRLLGMIESDLGRFDLALKQYQRCVRLQPREPHFQYLIGRTLADLGRSNEALAMFDKVLKAEPDSPFVTLSRAVALDRLGDPEQASNLIRPLLDGPDETPATATMYARLEARLGRHESTVDFLQERLGRNGLEPRDRQAMLFVLGTSLDKLAEYDRAFSAFHEANETNKPPFDRNAFAARLDSLIRVFSEPRLADPPRVSRRSELPIFIAGLPRSGTTLLEQIVDAHPKGQGAGELTDLSRLVDGLQIELDSYEPYPDCVDELTRESCDRLARGYLSHLKSFSRLALRVANKALDNWEHVGLISLLWPDARIVFSRRDPLDTCLSCYVNHILPARCRFVTDLQSLGFAYRQHEKMVAHWRSTLDVRMIEIVYEELVADQEPVSRQLIEFCELPWDESCLRFHESGRSVMTLSYDQVSKPIYRSSAGRWRNYEKHLGPLLEALEQSP